MRSLYLFRAVPVLVLLSVCLWSGVPSFGTPVPERLGERLPGLTGLTPDQEAEVQEILAEHRARLAPLADRPDALQAMWELQNETLEKLGTVLTPEELAQLRASLPAFSMLDRLIASRWESRPAGAQEASPATCSNGYNQVNAGRLSTELACSEGDRDYSNHTVHNPSTDLDDNPYAINDALVNCQARDAAAQAESLAYLALSDCTHADDAASAASTAASIANDGAFWARESEIFCASLGHPNAYAHNAYMAALQAKGALNDGAASLSACFSCCFTLAAPTGLHATATNASTIRLTWQDRNTRETNTSIERNSNGTGFQEVYLVGADISLKSDGSAPSTAGHRYRVRAYNSTCNLYSPYSAQALVPKAPTDLTGTRGTGAKYILNWQDRSGSINEEGFEIQRRVGTGSWGKLATVGADNTTYPATLVAGVNRFRVRALTSTGESWFTNEVSYTY